MAKTSVRTICAALLGGLTLGACMAALAATSLAQEVPEFVPLFDGKTLDGWEGDPAIWSVEDGQIVGTTNAENPISYNTFLIWRQGEVDDFVLQFEYKISDPGNSGVQYRSWESPPEQKWRVAGYQADFDGNARYAGIVYGEQFRGILANRGQETVIGSDHKPTVEEQFATSDELKEHIRVGQWNSYQVEARGFTVTHTINGHRMSECTDDDHEQRRREGILAIQAHRGPPMEVRIRNFRLKRLPMEDAKKIVFVAGGKSHGFMGHEHNAGCLLLADLLEQHGPDLVTTTYLNGWPSDPTAFQNADAVVLFSDGGGGNPARPHLDQVRELIDRGVGVAVLHYALQLPKGEAGQTWLDAIGGYYETYWSVNPHFEAEIESIPEHPVTRGVRPFSISDEWYYHMRFRPDMEGVTPLLTCVPPDATRQRPHGSHSGNPTVESRKGMPEHLAWVYERPDGGRGFGFTGGHWHYNWGHPDFLQLVLNGIAWTAKCEIPEGGIDAPAPSWERLLENQDYENNWPEDRVEAARSRLESWQQSP